MRAEPRKQIRHPAVSGARGGASRLDTRCRGEADHRAAAERTAGSGGRHDSADLSKPRRFHRRIDRQTEGDSRCAGGRRDADEVGAQPAGRPEGDRDTA